MADHEVMVAVDDESVAEGVSVGTAVPDVSVWVPGLATVTVLVTFQVKVADPVYPLESVAVRVTEQAQAVVGVPVTAPVDVLIDSPAGRPVADHEAMVAVDDESVAEGVRVPMAVPDVLVWVPGLATVTVLVTFQVKVVEADRDWLSVAVTVTEQAQAVVGVPLTTPPDEIDSPAGRPVAVVVTEFPPVVS